MVQCSVDYNNSTSKVRLGLSLLSGRNEETIDIIILTWVCWWHSGSCMSLHSLILAPGSYLIEVTLATCEKSVVQFDSNKHCRFTLGTPDP